MNQNSTSDVPSSKSEIKIKPLKVILVIFSIGTYIFDVGFDILLAVKHYKDGNETFFTLTIVFIAFPTVVNFGFSLYWYLTDEVKKSISTKQWIVRSIFLALGLAPILRTLESLYYAWKSVRSASPREQTKYAQRMIFESTDASHLRLFEAFLECAPQLIIQIYIFAQVQSLKACNSEFTSTEIQQLISIFSSLLSMSWAIVSYLRVLRESLDEKKDIKFCVSIIMLLWHFFELTSRTLVLGLFASFSPSYLCLVCMVHFTVMFTWIRKMKTDFCESQLGELLYNTVVGIIFIFCYFNPKDNPTKQRRTFFYILMFLENAVLMVIWFLFYPPDVYLKIPVTIVHFLSFFSAIFIMISYYSMCHPSRKTITSRQTYEMEDHCNGDIMVNGIEKNKELIRGNHENPASEENYEKLMCGENCVKKSELTLQG